MWQRHLHQPQSWGTSCVLAGLCWTKRKSEALLNLIDIRRTAQPSANLREDWKLLLSNETMKQGWCGLGYVMGRCLLPRLCLGVSREGGLKRPEKTTYLGKKGVSSRLSTSFSEDDDLVNQMHEWLVSRLNIFAGFIVASSWQKGFHTQNLQGFESDIFNGCKITTKY